MWTRRNGTELLFHLIGDLFHLLFVVFFFSSAIGASVLHLMPEKQTPLDLIT